MSVELFLDTFLTAKFVDAFLLDTLLDTYLDTFICRALLTFYIKVQRDPFLTFLDLSLNRLVFSPPKPLSLTPNFFLKVSSGSFQVFLHLVSFLSLIFMHFMF